MCGYLPPKIQREPKGEGPARTPSILGGGSHRQYKIFRT